MADGIAKYTEAEVQQEILSEEIKEIYQVSQIFSLSEVR